MCGSRLAARAGMLKTFFMSDWFGSLFCATGILWLATGNATGQTILEPPFGMKWGDSPEKLIHWASEHNLNVSISLLGNQPRMRILKIVPQKGFLPETQAGAIEGHFFSGKLYEVTLHYADADATADMMEQRFETIKKQMTHEHGTMLANQQRKAVVDQFVTRTQAFHREVVKGLFLLLAFTEVEDLLRKSKETKFSLIYRNDNFKEELMKKTKEI